MKDKGKKSFNSNSGADVCDGFLHNKIKEEPFIKNICVAKKIKKIYISQKTRTRFNFAGLFKPKFKLLNEKDRELIEKEVAKADTRIDSTKSISNAKKEVIEQTTGIKKIWSSIFFAFNIIIAGTILIVQFKSSQSTSLYALLEGGANIFLLFIAFVMFVFVMILESLRFAILIKNSTGRFRPILSYKTVAIGKYYGSILPFATGGQPFQVMYLKKNNISSGIASTVPFARFIFSQTAFIILAIIFLFVNANLSSVTGVGESIVNVAAYVSVTLNLILISVLLVLVTSKRIGLIFTIIILKILNKLKIVKDYSKTFKKVTRYVREYQHAVRKYIVGSSESLSSFIVSVLIWIISGSIPFFLYLAFTNVETITFELWLLIISKYFALMLATSLLPLPGATGTAELSFAALFGTLFSGSALVWAILFWRLLTYYVYILQGIIVIVFNAIKVKFLKHKATQIA